MKKVYEKPMIEIIEFEAEDILASGLTNGGPGISDGTDWGGISSE